jgi:hypothetical protein
VRSRRTRSRSWRSPPATSPPPWGPSPGARAGGSPTSSPSTPSSPRVLWFDGERFRALGQEESEAFAVLPAEEVRAGPRGATLSIGEAQEEALQALHARLQASVQERSLAAFDASRERWDRSVEDALVASRKAVEDARAAWAKARGALHDESASALPLRDRRALLERAEREYRRKLDELRATEAQRYAERDRATADLRKRADPKERRTLVATAYWRCG